MRAGARATGAVPATSRSRPSSRACSLGAVRGSRRPSRSRGWDAPPFAFVANCDPYTYAGRVPLHVAPRARFELGLDVVAPVALTAAALPRFVAYAVRGKGQTAASDILEGHDLDRIEIACDRPLPLQADGEDLGDVEHVVFEAERDAVGVLC